MRKLIGFFVDRSLVVNLITVGVIVFGALAMRTTTRALIPKERLSYVEVYADLPGASAMDMERFVTFRIEEALTGMDRVERISSTTKNGRSHVRIRVKPEVKTLTPTMEEVRSRLSSVTHLLPQDLRPLRVEQQKRQNAQFVVTVLVTHLDGENLVQRAAINTLADRLRRVPNVIAINTTLPKLRLVVRFSRAKLASLGVDMVMARRRVVAYLAQMPVGAVRHRDRDISIELGRPFTKLADLKSMPLRVNRLGQGVLLSDVATVAVDIAPKVKERRLNGRSDYVELKVVASYEADSIEISQKVREILKKEASKLLPAPLKWRIGFDTSGLIAHELDTLVGNGLGGIVIVLVVLMIFLGWRVSLMTAIGLPFTYMGIVLALQLFGINFNLISLVAMLLVIGILVDDAIIVSEEYCQRLGAGMEGREAAIEAVSRVAKPVLGMVATTSVAFMPALILEGGPSWIIRPLPIVIISALFISLFESFLLLPNHLKHFLPPKARPRDRRFIALLQRGYRFSLCGALKVRYLTVLVAFALVASAVALMVSGAVRFSGDLNLMGSARIYVELKEPAKSLDDLAQQVAPVEALIKALPSELRDHYMTYLGQAVQPGSGGHRVRGWKYVGIQLVPKGSFVEQEERRFIAAGILQKKLAALQKSDKRYRRLVVHEAAPNETKDSVTVYVSGGDRIEFNEIQDAVRKRLTGVSGVVDIYMDDARFQQAFVFKADEKKILAYGLSKARLRAQLRERFARHELMRLRHRGEELEVFLRVDNPEETTVASLAELKVIGGRDTAVPLSYLGSWRSVSVLRRIEHRDMLRLFQIDVVYNRKSTDAKKVSQQIESKLASLRKSYPGYHISVKPSEEEEKNKAWLINLVVICVGLIYLCLALSLGSLVQPVVVLFAIPFGFAGVVFAFYVHGMALGIMAVIGILGLAGVVVNDSLVMAASVNDCHRRDPDGGMRQAIIDGCTMRLRAVVLTSLTTLGGVFPLAYGLAGKAGWIQPMVFAVGWGLLVATIITLFFIPSLLLIFEDFAGLGRRIKRLVLRTG